MLRVDVDLYYILVVYHHNAVADAFKVAPEIRRHLLGQIPVYDVLGAVAEYYLLVVLYLKVELAFRGALRLLCLSRLPPECTQHFLKYYAQTVAACIHDPCLLEHGELLRSLL